MRAERLGSDASSTLLFDLRALVLLAREIRELVLQLQIAFQSARWETAFVHRVLHRTSRLVTMTAIGEVTRGRQRFDIVERFAHRLTRVPQLELAHAWRVDQQTTVWQAHELAVAGGVTAFRISVADYLR